jgi:hypothetical protein
MLPSHEEQGGLLAKRKKMLRGDVNAFIDPTELARYADGSEAAFDKELARPKRRKPVRPGAELIPLPREALERPERPDLSGADHDRSHHPSWPRRRPEGRRQGTHPDPRRLVGRDVPEEEAVEADYRAERFADYDGQMKGNNDILCLTRPDLVAELHDAYFAAGADISETNTFSGTTIAQADYRLGADVVRDINFEGARIGRSVADRWNAENPTSRASSPARSGR